MRTSVIDDQRSERPAPWRPGLRACRSGGGITFNSSRGFICLAVCCLIAAICRADDQPRTAGPASIAPEARVAVREAVGAAVRSAVEKGLVAGAVVHVSQAGRTLLVEAYGQSDRDR